ncbi:hypothetical protein BGZ68_010381 [Mortierella alpina]|nr:hypothetical protein BGZ68_010381 [Mortierella alpina]
MALSNASNSGTAEADVLTERLPEITATSLTPAPAPAPALTIIDSPTSPVIIFHAHAHLELPDRLGPLALALSANNDGDDHDSAAYEAAAPSADPLPTATHKPKPKARSKKKPKPRRSHSHTPATAATYTQSSFSFAPTPSSSHGSGEVSPTSANASPTETYNPEVNTDKPTTAPRPNPDTRASHSDTPPTPIAARTTTTTTNAEVTPIITATSLLSTATPIATATTAATTAVATPPTPVSSHGSRHTKSTTPWLPSSIVPIVAPPKVTSTPSPGTSLPDVVIPDLKPNIPPHSMNVQLRLERVSYAQVIDDGVLAAQLVSFIPAQLSYLLDAEQSKILVLAIRDGTSATTDNGHGNRKRDLVPSTNAYDAILVTVAIPRDKYHVLDELVQNRGSMLYFPSATGFGQFVDSKYPLSAHPPSKAVPGGDHEDDDDNTADPLTGEAPGVIPNPTKNRSGGVGNGPLIGSVVGLATAAYVGIAMLVVRRYRRKKLREQQREALHQSISAPIHVSGSTQAWAWHGS